MGKMPDNGRDDANRRPQGASAAMRDLKDWFIREVLPLESALMQFLRQNWRDKADIADLRQVVLDSGPDFVGKVGVDDRLALLFNVLDQVAQPQPHQLQ